METKKETPKVVITKGKISENKAVKKKLSKTMKGAMKIQGAFDREEVLKFVHSI